MLGLPTGPDAAPPPPPGAMGAPRGLSSLGLGDEPASEDEGERESLTSEILAGGSDWAAEFLLLTHEPLRREEQHQEDYAAIQVVERVLGPIAGPRQ